VTPPVDFSEFRRDIQARFQPTRTLITEDSKPHAVLRQVTSLPPPVGGSPGRVLPPSPLIEAQDAAEAVRQAYEHPTYERTAEVTVVTGAGGEIVRIEVSASSGQQHFDEVGVEAVRSALTGQRSNPKLRDVRMRWRLRASYAVTMPRVLVPLGRGLPVPQPVWWEFNEANGTIATKRAFADKIDTEVSLISVTAASE
jgi:hypothetical protein